MVDLLIDFADGMDRRALYSILKDLKGKHVIKIKKQGGGRSLQENRYYWKVVLGYISDYTGHDPAYLHEIFKFEFIPDVKFEDDYRLTTTDMTHEQIWAFIDKVVAWALTFLGLKIPMPNEVII